MINLFTNRTREARPLKLKATRAGYKDCQPAAKGAAYRTLISAPENSPVFTTTHWSIVLKAGRGESEQADDALEKLCRAYWYPIYIFLRRSGCPTGSKSRCKPCHRTLARPRQAVGMKTAPWQPM